MEGALDVRARPRDGTGIGAALDRALLLLAFALIGGVLATRLGHLLDDPLLSAYAVLTIAVTGFVMYLAFARYADPSVDPPVRVWRPRVSCLVAVKNEEDVIERCVTSLLAQRYPDVEVIVIDDCSTDRTRVRLVELQARHPALKVLFLPESVRKKRALTQGVLEATGEILLFTDSDCVLADDAAERVVAAFAAHPELGAVSGDCRALNGDHNFLTRTQDAWYDGQFSVWKASESVFGAVTCISGPLAAFRRDAVYNFFPAWAGDTFLGHEFPFATDRQLTGFVLGSDVVGHALKQRYSTSSFVCDEDYPTRRWRIAYVESARAWTVVPHTFGRVVKQQVRWKKSFIRNLFFTGRFYWRRGLAPAFVYYAHAAFVVATPFMAARHLVYLPVKGDYSLAAVFFGGVFLKGLIWALAFKVQNPGSTRWRYRPFMSLLSTGVFAFLLPYSALTIKRQVWARG